MNNGSNILTVDSLHKSFEGIKAVDDLSFKLKEGIITAVIGPNGAGKTTLFNMLTGFLPSDGGSIYFDDKKITTASPHRIARLGIGRTFQNVRLFSQMTVLDNVMLALKYNKGHGLWAALVRHKTMKAEEEYNRQQAIKYLQMIDMVHKQDQLAEDLSHGQRKLVEIARTLALKPKLMLLDEPTAGLYAEMIDQVKKIICKLRDSGITICFIEHNMKTVMDIADQIVVLNQGRLIAQGTPQQIQGNEVVIEAYLGRKR